MELVVPDEIFYTVGVFGTISCGLGIVSNVLNLLVFAKRKSDSTSGPQVFFLTVSLFDLLYVVLCLIFVSVHVISQRIGSETMMGPPSRYVEGLINMAATGSILTTTALAVDRSIAVEKPFKWSLLCNRHRSYFIVTAIIIFTIIMNLPLVFEDHIVVYRYPYRHQLDFRDPINSTTHRSGHESNPSHTRIDHTDTCGDMASPHLQPRLCPHEDESSVEFILYYLVYIHTLIPFFQLVIPAVIIIVTTARIVRKLRHSKIDADFPSSTNEKPPKHRKSSNRISAQVSIMAALNVLSNGMLASTFLMMAVKNMHYANRCSCGCMLFIGVSHLVVALSSSAKIVIHCYFNKLYRDEVYDLLTFKCLSRFCHNKVHP